MITLIEALRFRCLRDVRQPIGRFHVLVGANASGKTTFLDVPALLGRLVSDGLEAAVQEWSHNLQDLVWRRESGSFEVAIEVHIPEERRRLLANPTLDTVRYEVSIGLHPNTGEMAILAEKVALKGASPVEPQQRLRFPWAAVPRKTLLTRSSKGSKTVVNKISDSHDNFYDETGKGWDHAFKLGPRKSALGNLPEDESKFPVSTWLKGILTGGVQQFMLNSLFIRKASPPGQVRGFKPDGSNLPWVIAELEKREPARLRDWMAHVQTALPDLVGIRTVERPDDKHRYLVLCYRGGPGGAVMDGLGRDASPARPHLAGVPSELLGHLSDRRTRERHPPPGCRDDVSVSLVGVQRADSPRDPLSGDLERR